MNRFTILAACAFFLALPLAGQRQPVALTLDEALERARRSSPSVVLARMQIDEARARVAGASLLLSSNPSLEIETGRRTGESSSTDYGLEVSQELDLPGRRGARIDAARAVVTQEEQRARDAEREALHEIATTFLRAVEASERAVATESARLLAEETLRIAESRYAAGDVAQLDVNLARTAVAHAEADVRIANATLTGHVTHLQILLDMTDPVNIVGSLHESDIVPTADLLLRAWDRPEVRVLDALIEEAEAERRIARTLRWPDFGLRAAYESEEGDRIVRGGVGFSLPFFYRGQEAAAVASARLERLRVQREAVTRRVEAEIRGAAATYDGLRAVAAEYERTVIPLIEENERLALESYEVGQIGLADLLLVRREALEARRSLIDQLIETRLAEADLRAAAGVWK